MNGKALTLSGLAVGGGAAGQRGSGDDPPVEG